MTVIDPKMPWNMEVELFIESPLTPLYQRGEFIISPFGKGGGRGFSK